MMATLAVLVAGVEWTVTNDILSFYAQKQEMRHCAEEGPGRGEVSQFPE